MDSRYFYQHLPAHQLPLADLFRSNYFSPVPADWQVIISDVKNSTQAVAAGRYNEVNLVAAGSLIAALNVAKKYRTEVPFFFGGDGSTLLMPGDFHQEVMTALAGHNQNSSRHFGLPLHIGSVPVKTIRENGCTLVLARLQIDATYSKAVALGDGLRFAEKLIKQDLAHADAQPAANEPNLTGLECRWNRVKPPAEEAANVCYLVEAVQPQKQAEVYASVFETMDAIFGDWQNRHPLCEAELKPALGWKKLRQEMLVRFGKWKPAYFAETFVQLFFGRFALRYNWRIGGIRARDYLKQLIAHADTLAVDGRVNTIICGTPDKHRRFLQFLAEQEGSGRLVFGHHWSKESIMTCYIEARDARHIHFVDGADGGYTEASKEFKAKFRQWQPVT